MYVCPPARKNGCSRLSGGKIINQSINQSEIVIVAPVWKSQSWYPVLLSLLFNFPHLITSPPDQLLSQESVTSIPVPGSTAGRMAHLRNFCQAEKFSKQASELLLASWRDKSTKAYNSLFHKWECWCAQRDRNPISGSVVDIANFLAELYQDGYAYSSLNSYRSAISSVHEHIEGYPVGQHPQIARILKGAYNLRPPKPRYSNTWKVSTVVTWLDSIDLKSSGLSLMKLSIKTVLLLALTRPLRSADLASFQLSNIRYLPEGVIITPSHLSKQSQWESLLKIFSFRPLQSIQTFVLLTQ